jgi:hypothetical protein
MLLLIFFIFSCGIIINNPLPFDKDEWIKCGGFDGKNYISDDLFVSGNTRYRMSLWLENNYNFYDKSLDEIIKKFYIVPDNFSDYQNKDLDQVKNNKILNIIVKQYNPNFIIGIDDWINIDWIEVFFDGDYIVSNVYYINFNPKTQQKTKRLIVPIVESKE